VDALDAPAPIYFFDEERLLRFYSLARFGYQPINCRKFAIVAVFERHAPIPLVLSCGSIQSAFELYVRSVFTLNLRCGELS
jgi:hypothetical protein